MSVHECLESKWEYIVGLDHRHTREAGRAPTSRCIPKASNQQAHSKTSFGLVHESVTAVGWYRTGDTERERERGKFDLMPKACDIDDMDCNQ